MELSALAGNRRVKEQLRHRGADLPHACLITGPAGTGRHTLARLLAAAMVCQGAGERPCGRCAPCKKVFGGIHPDVSLIGGADGKPIAVDQVRTLRADAYVRPNEGERKVYILEGADRMNAAAQNAMLKLLEEGPPYAAFLLLGENPGGVLQTVRSRCIQLSLAPVAPEEGLAWLEGRFPGRDREELRRTLLDSQGVLGRAVQALEGKDEGVRARRTLAEDLCRAMTEGDEETLFEASMALDRLGREEVAPLLEELEGLLGSRAARPEDRKRAVRAAALVRRLRKAARLNVGQGQLSGWLCAGMFTEESGSGR